MPKPSLITLVLFITLTICAAQQTVTNHDVRVTFPTAEWAESEAPPEIHEAIGKIPMAAALVFHATSASKSRLIIARLIFPETVDRDVAVIKFLESARKRAEQASLNPPVETSGNLGAYRNVTFEMEPSTNVFLGIRCVLCEHSIYSLEITGPSESRAEFLRLLDNVVITGDTPLPVAVDNVMAVSAGIAEESSLAFRIGQVLGYVIVFGVIGLVVYFGIKRFSSGDKPPDVP